MFEVFILILIVATLVGFIALLSISPSRDNGRITMNNMPGDQSSHLTDEEKYLQSKFYTFLEENHIRGFDLRPLYYNLRSGTKGVIKSGKEWIYYEMGDRKKLNVEERFSTQMEAYQFAAKELRLEFIGE